MSNKSLVLTFMFGALVMSGAVLNSHAASPPAPTPRTAMADSIAEAAAAPTELALSCEEQICHSTAECNAGTTSCGVCVIPPGSFFGHCHLK